MVCLITTLSGLAQIHVALPRVARWQTFIANKMLGRLEIKKGFSVAIRFSNNK